MQDTEGRSGSRLKINYPVSVIVKSKGITAKQNSSL